MNDEEISARSTAIRSIGLIVGNIDDGAFGNVASGLAKGLVANGTSVEVAFIKGDYRRFRTRLPAEVDLVKLNARRSLFSTRAIARYLRTRSPDVAISLGWLQNLPGAIASKLSRWGGTFVLSEHGHVSYESAVEHGDKFLYRNFPKAARRAYPWAHGLVAVDGGILEDLASNVGVDLTRLRCEVIPNSVDVERVRALAAEGDIERTTDPMIVTAGRLAPQKNQRLLIEAFAEVVQEVPARLKLLGEGPLRNDLEGLARALGVDDRVLFEGHVDNPYAHIAAADVFVLPSRIEGCPLSLLEALACGCPPIATDGAPGPVEILGAGRFGRVVESENRGALAEAIVSMLKGVEPAATFRRTGPERALDFHPAAIGRRWLDFLVEVAEGRR